MTVAATSGPSSGWYPDPNDPQSLRWWNGTAWTEFTARVPATEPEPQAAEPAPFVATTSEPFVLADDDAGEGWSAYIDALEPQAEPPPRVDAIKESPSAIRIHALDALVAAVAGDPEPDAPVAEELEQVDAAWFEAYVAEEETETEPTVAIDAVDDRWMAAYLAEFEASEAHLAEVIEADAAEEHEPVVEPEPVAAVEPEPAAVADPEPPAVVQLPEPDLAFEASPAVAAEPPEPDPAPAAEPLAVAEPPEPVLAVEPQPEPVVEPEPVAEPAPAAAPRGFSFRARAVAPREHEYESPLATIASPLLSRPVAPAAPASAIAAEIVEPEATQEVDAVVQAAPAPEPAPRLPAHEPEAPADTVEAAAVAAPARRRPTRRTGIAAVAIAAAGAAGITNLIGGDDAGSATKGRATAATTAGSTATGAAAPDVDTECLKLWNTTDSQSASQLRVTLGQFAGANAQIGRVKPLPGTLMEPDSCGLLVYDPGTDTSAVFVAGVKDQIGFLDVTAYPRAGATYGMPKTSAAANVQVMKDGTLRTN